MPEELEKELKDRAKKKGFGKKRTGKYVFGTMRKTGWTPSHQKKTNNPIAEEVKRRANKKHG